MKNNLLFCFIASLLFTGTLRAQPCDCDWPTDVILLHVNDMHAKIDNMGKLAYLADSLERSCKHVFIVAAGDNFTGNPVVDMVADKGYPMIDLMNRIGFDVSAIGNHEFDLGQETLNRRTRQARFRFVSCNVDATNARLKQPKAFKKRCVGKGNRMLFLGVTQIGQNGMPDTHPSRLEGLQFCDPIGTAKRYAKFKDKYVLVALTHLGLETDQQLAEAMPQLDLIIGGHSHDRLDTGLTRNGVLITQAGSGLKYVGKTFLRIDKGKVIYKKEEMIPLADLHKSNPKVQSLIDRYNANEELSRVVGRAEAPLEGYAQLGSLMCDALVNVMKADFAFQNRGGIRVSSLPQGDLALKDVFRLDPFGNKIVTFRMTVAEMQSLIRYGFGLTNSLDLEVAGMTYEVLLGDNGQVKGVVMKDLQGNPLDPSKAYLVAVNSYIAAAYQFDHQDPGTTSDLTTAEALISYLEQVKSVNYTGIHRISTVKPGH